VHEVENYEVLAIAQPGVAAVAAGGASGAGFESAQRKIFVLVTSSGERKFGLIVDNLVGEEELVIKALDDQSISTDLISRRFHTWGWAGSANPQSAVAGGAFTKANGNAAGSRLAGLLRNDTGDGVESARGRSLHEQTGAACSWWTTPPDAETDSENSLASDNSIEVVGTAMDGNFGLKKIEELAPQVITLRSGNAGIERDRHAERGYAAMAVAR